MKASTAASPNVRHHFMRHFTILIIFILLGLPFKISAQQQFENQEEQKDNWAIELFNNGYSKQIFKRFNGQILEVNNNLIKYDSAVLRILTSNLAIKQIFVLGIFYPAIFDDPRIYDTSIKSISFTKPLSNKEKVLMDQTSPISNDTFNQKKTQDTATISVIEELNFLTKSPKIKRFKMWVKRHRLLNPIVYYIELTNDKATKDTDLGTFIMGSSLTFVREGRIII